MSASAATSPLSPGAHPRPLHAPAGIGGAPTPRLGTAAAAAWRSAVLCDVNLRPLLLVKEFTDGGVQLTLR